MYKVKLDEEKRSRSDKTAKRRESSATQQGVRTNQTAAKVLIYLNTFGLLQFEKEKRNNDN